MPEVDVTKAAMEAAKKLNLDLKDEEEEPEVQPTGEEEGEPEGEPEEELEGEEPEVEEVEPEEEPKGKAKPKMVPYSRLAETIKKMRTYERAIQMMLDQQAVNQPKEKAEPEEKEEPVKIPQFDSTEEAMAWFMKVSDERQDKRIDKAIRKVIEPMKQTAAVERAKVDIARLAKEHEDFYDYYDKMMTIAQRNPTLSADEVYILAKGSATDKQRVKSIVKKVADKAALKKKANTEKRSSAVDRMDVDSSKFKTVREAAEHVAKKMGLT